MFSNLINRNYRIVASYPKKLAGRDLLELFWSMTPDSEGGDRVERVLSEIGGDWTLVDVQLSDISFSESLVSGKGSQKLITKYANKSSEMPPVILDFVYDDYEIIDGFHRIAAAKKRGDTKIKAYVPAG